MDPKFKKIFKTVSEPNLKKIAFNISHKIKSETIIGLSGDLGSGKTTLTKYIGQALGSDDWINSPTYSIIQRYRSTKFNIVHIDLYRCKSQHEINQLDIQSYCKGDYIMLIEWVDQMPQIKPDILIHLEYISQTKRHMTISSESNPWVITLDDTNSN